MDIAASLIKLFFGSKADKDRKEVEPYLVKIKAVYPTIEALSNDELRARSSNLKKQIADFIAADEARIVELKARLELPDTSLSDKEKISKEIDETVKRIDEKIEQKLDELLPEAFAIMKDTARRFAQNETVEVTANDFDRELAATKDFVKIEGDKADLCDALARRRQRRPLGHDPLRCAALRRRGAPQRQDRRDGDGRRQNPGGYPPRVPERTRRQRRPHGDRERLSGTPRLRMDGADVPVPRSDGRLHRPPSAQLGRPTQGLHGRHHLRHQQRIRLRLPARQHGFVAQGPGAAQAPLRHRR